MISITERPLSQAPISPIERKEKEVETSIVRVHCQSLIPISFTPSSVSNISIDTDNTTLLERNQFAHIVYSNLDDLLKNPDSWPYLREYAIKRRLSGMNFLIRYTQLKNLENEDSITTRKFQWKVFTLFNNYMNENKKNHIDPSLDVVNVSGKLMVRLRNGIRKLLYRLSNGTALNKDEIKTILRDFETAYNVVYKMINQDRFLNKKNNGWFSSIEFRLFLRITSVQETEKQTALVFSKKRKNFFCCCTDTSVIDG